MRQKRLTQAAFVTFLVAVGTYLGVEAADTTEAVNFAELAGQWEGRTLTTQSGDCGFKGRAVSLFFVVVWRVPL